MIDFRFISIIKLINHFTFAVNQENCEINLRVNRVLTDYNKNLSRATDRHGVIFFGVGISDDGNDRYTVESGYEIRQRRTLTCYAKNELLIDNGIQKCIRILIKGESFL